MSSFSLPSPAITSVTTTQQCQYGNVMASPASFSSGNRIYHPASVRYESYLHQWHSGGAERATSRLYDATKEAGVEVSEAATQSRRSAQRITTYQPYKSYKRLTTSQSERMLARLGKESDASVAADFGVTKKTIQKRRSSLGIPAFQPHKPKVKLTLSQSRSAQARLGKESDASIAADLGVSHTMIRNRRCAQGIVACKLRKPYTKLTQSQLDSIQARLGKETDLSIAADFGVSKSVIQNRRNAQGIPAYYTHKAHRKLTQSQLDNIQARLGKETDLSIAADFGMTRTAILKRRHAQGIDAYEPPKLTKQLTQSQSDSIQARLGKETDATTIEADVEESANMIWRSRFDQGSTAYEPYVSHQLHQFPDIFPRLEQVNNPTTHFLDLDLDLDLEQDHDHEINQHASMVSTFEYHF